MIPDTPENPIRKAGEPLTLLPGGELKEVKGEDYLSAYQHTCVLRMNSLDSLPYLELIMT